MKLPKKLSGNKRKTEHKKGKPAIPPIDYELGDGYFLASEQKPNGLGGYATVNTGLYKDERLIRQITDENGQFLNFPGILHGKWEEELRFPFRPIVRFTIHYNKFRDNGLAEFFWMVQPDGRYWADDDGFGMENDSEIVLCAEFDQTGKFVTPFHLPEK